MKLSLFPFLILLFLGGSVFAQNIAPNSGSRACSMRKSTLKTANRPIRGKTSGPTHSFDVLDYKMDINIYKCYTPPNPKDYKATVILTIKATEAIDTVRLNADNASLFIDSVRMAGQSFIHTADTLFIKLNRIYQPGEVLQVKIGYHHANLNDGGFNCTNYHGAGVVFTDAEPQGARKWFPCWDDPSDKATLDLHAKVPSNVKLGCNGILADSLFIGDTLVYHWVSSHPISTYLIVLTSRTNYQLDIRYWHKPSNPSDSIPMRFYFNPGENPSTIENIIPGMTDYFSMRFNEHPFQKNGFATIDTLFTWGGMENQTLTSLCKGCWSESLVAHEFAHQWFGDMITCASWADLFINEGFATWCETNWNEYKYGYPVYKSQIVNYAMEYKVNNPGWAVSVPEWATNPPSNDTLFDWYVTYEKGACILHQLRYLLGDTLFYTTLRNYSSDSNFRFKNASVADFNAKVNEVSGENFDWFFNDWVFQPNHPVYNNTYNFENLGNGQWQVNFFTFQEQQDPEFFRMMIEVRVLFADNSDTTFRFMNDVNYQICSWTFDKQPVYFLFDPLNDIVLKEQTTVVGIPGSKGSCDLSLISCIPNPARDKTRIVFSISKSSVMRVEISDATGRNLQSTNLGTLPAGAHSYVLDCSSLAPGIYFFRLFSPEGVRTGKLLIEK